jgi:Ran GTPase-activating protein 1
MAASDEEDEGVEAQEKAARDIIADQQAEESNVAQKDDKDVDALADVLAKTEIRPKEA